MVRKKDWYSDLKTRYRHFPRDVQILNVVSDLEKAMRMHDVDLNASRNHLYRALILLQYMADDPKWRKALRELLRLKTCVASTLTDHPFGSIEQIIQAALGLNPDAYQRMQG